MNRAIDDIAGMIVGLMMISLGLALIVVFVAVALFAGLTILFLKRQITLQLELGETLSLPARQFGAPPRSQWLGAYEHWLFQLEQATGVDFNTSPGRILMGALILTVGAALVIGLLMAVLSPAYAGSWLTYLPLAGVIIGGVTGWRLGQPVTGWFDPRNGSGSGDGSDDSNQDGFTLGHGDW